MTDRLQLSTDEVSTLKSFFIARDYPGGYRYIESVIHQHQEFDQSTAFWFSAAATINANVRSDPADVYIRSATRAGLKWDNRLGDDEVRNAKLMQDTSDQIARNVLGSVAETQVVSDVGAFLNADIVAALAAGQTIGGWGGAFYYWDAPFVRKDGTKTTVGGAILADPADYEKFIAINARAALDAIFLTELPAQRPRPLAYDGMDLGVFQKIGQLFDALAASWHAQAPASVQSEIKDRTWSIFKGGSMAGDPDHIGNYFYKRAGGLDWYIWDQVLPPIAAGSADGGVVPLPVQKYLRDAALIAQLDVRREVRLSHQGFRP